MKKRIFKKPLLSKSTYQENLDDDLLVEETDTELLNHQRFGDILVDPDSDISEDLHKPLFARARKPRKVMAAEIDYDDDEVLVDDMPEQGLIDKEDILAEEDPFYADDDDVNSISPADLIVSDSDDIVVDDEPFIVEDATCKASVKPAVHVLSLAETDTMPSDIKPQEKVDVEKALEDTAPEVNPETKQRAGKGEGDVAKVESKKAKKKVKAEEKEEIVLDNGQKSGQLTIESSMDYSLVDIDGVKDSVEDVMFASVGDTKWAVHSNRIIATLDRESAKQLSADDIYLEDEYDEATLAEVKSKGLRAGLRCMGYKLATVTIKSSAQVKANVAKLTAANKAELEAKVAARDKVLQDSLILAAVGLNRNIFKDYDNTLRSGLVAALRSAGVRNASRLVRAEFERNGIDYSKKLMTIASDIADLPPETREGLASQLDMTLEADEEDILADPNLYGDPVAEVEDDDFGSVEAALRNPIKASVSKQSTLVDDRLPFVHF